MTNGQISAVILVNFSASLIMLSPLQRLRRRMVCRGTGAAGDGGGGRLRVAAASGTSGAAGASGRRVVLALGSRCGSAGAAHLLERLRRRGHLAHHRKGQRGQVGALAARRRRVAAGAAHAQGHGQGQSGPQDHREVHLRQRPEFAEASAAAAAVRGQHRGAAPRTGGAPRARESQRGGLEFWRVLGPAGKTSLAARRPQGSRGRGSGAV